MQLRHVRRGIGLQQVALACVMCVSALPPNQMSVRGFCASAVIWARISPEDLRVIATRMPVSRWKAAAMASHQSAAGAQSMFRLP
jgi:hypothetical protein